MMTPEEGKTMAAPRQSFHSDAPENIRVRRIVSILSIVLLLVLYGAIAYFIGYPLARQFTSSPETFREFVSSHGIGGQLVMIGIIVLQVVVAIIPGEPFEVGAGFVFGWLEGMILCLIGSALASALIFLGTKKWGIKMAELFFPREKLLRFSFLRNEKKLNLLIFILFLIPGTPKDMITYLVGMTPMKLSTFLILTSLARIPSVVSSTVTGSLAQEGNLLAAAITYGITLVISAVCIWWYRKVSKETEKPNHESQ